MFRAIRVGYMPFSRCPYLGRIVVDAEPFHPFNTCPYLMGIDHAMSECRHFEDIRFKGELNWKFSENGNFAYAHVRMQLSRIWVNSVSWRIYICEDIDDSSANWLLEFRNKCYFGRRMEFKTEFMKKSRKKPYLCWIELDVERILLHSRNPCLGRIDLEI